MRLAPLGAALACALSVSIVSGCRSEEATGAGAFPRSETLYVGGVQWGEPSSFNPLLTSPDWPVRPVNLLVYESLLQFDPLSGELKPLLAESFAVRDDEIEIVLNPAARFNDGKPVTGADVQYTFELGKKYRSLQVSPYWKYLSEVKLADEHESPYPRRVVFVFDKTRKNPLLIKDSLVEIRITPKHVIEPLLARVQGDIEEFNKLKFDRDPVGSGPYRLSTYSSEKIVLVRDDAYWGNAALHAGAKPGPRFIIHPIYKSNDHFSVALQQGRLDVSSTFVPRIWLKARKGVRSWFEKEPFFVPAAIPMLYINATHKPVDDVRMRRAMAFAINDRDIRELAVSGYSAPLQPGLILPFGLEAKYFSEEDARQYGASFDPERAKALLKEAGYSPVWGPDGQLVETRDAQGNKVPTIYVKSPTGWTDWESVVRIAVRSMREVGIDARERFVDASLFWTALFTGDFDLLMYTPSPRAQPSKPWSRFDELITGKEWAKEGEKVYKNQGRFNNPNGSGYVPRFDELLDLIPTLKSEAELVSAYRELNRLFMQYQPALPLMYKPDQFYEVSVRHWDGFPTADNPYAPPQMPGDRVGTNILWHIHSVAP